MRMTVFSYKPCWAADGGYATDGGFPYQMRVLAELVDGLTLLLPLRPGPPPPGARRLEGPGIEVVPLPEPRGHGLRRKLRLPGWLLRHGGRLWTAAGRADAVHALVPGDLGTLGLLAALARRKPLFVRHCGTWGLRATGADRFLSWLLPRIAGGRNVVLATGGGAGPPQPGKPAVSWIFSTTLGRGELAALPAAAPWRPGEPLRLVTVGRLTAGKNAAAAVAALPEIHRHRPGATLEVVGDGPCRRDLQQQADAAGVAPAVSFPGNLAHDEVLRVLAGCHLFLFPTRVAEGFPKAVIEAMACGLPVLAPPVSVLPHLLREGGGWLLEDSGAGAVARAVIEATADAGELARRGQAARRIAAGYTLEAWRETIRERLEAAWGRSLKAEGESAAARGAS